MKNFSLLIVSSLILGCGGGGGGSSGSVVNVNSISWSVPTLRVNGTVLLLNEIKGYQFCYVKDDGPETCSIFNVSTPAQSTYSISDLTPGDYQITLALIDTNENYSDKSSVLTHSIN